MEVAFGVIPLVFEAVKLSKALRGKLSSARSYMDTVDEVQVRFEAQIMAFLHECKLVLRAAAGGNRDVDVARLLEDVDHGDWTSPELEDCLQSYLGNSLELFKKLVGSICKKVSKLGNDLSKFDGRGEDGREVCAELGVCQPPWTSVQQEADTQLPRAARLRTECGTDSAFRSTKTGTTRNSRTWKDSSPASAPCA